MGSVNKVILVGNLGRDAELKFSPSGFPISTFSLATTDRRKDKDNQWSDKTEWHRIKLLGKQAESLKDYLKKGKQIYVEGRLETRSWDDKDGQKKYMTEIIADRIQLLGSGGGSRDRASDDLDSLRRRRPLTTTSPSDTTRRLTNDGFSRHSSRTRRHITRSCWRSLPSSKVWLPTSANPHLR
jgi:single-strand DNA-binding protein